MIIRATVGKAPGLYQHNKINYNNNNNVKSRDKNRFDELFLSISNGLENSVGKYPNKKCLIFYLV